MFRKLYRRAAKPQDLFLNFGETFEAYFDGQVATRHHDSNRMMAQGRDHDQRELIESLTAFDLEIAAALPPQLFKGFLKNFQPNLCLGIVLSKNVEDADEPHTLTLLCTAH
jgi:predicted 2-oxoglutarate/Fe(II)-dependent dioxygenase YbiX